MKYIYILLFLSILPGCQPPVEVLEPIETIEPVEVVETTITRELTTQQISSNRTVMPLETKPYSTITIASRYMWFHEREHRRELQEFLDVDPVKIDWCAAFVNAVLRELSIPGSDTVSEWPLTARSFLQWGQRVREPQVGDIVIFPRGTESWQGHVGFYYGTEYRNGRRFYQILGGNQSNAVTIQLFPARSAISIRRYRS
jgi:uncharacterized protein (TIGR02594 family)